MRKLVKLMWDTRLPTYINCIRLGGVTNCSWPSGAAAESDTLDTVCDRGSLTNQTITTSGSIKAGNGKAVMQSDGTIVANSNLVVKGSARVDSTMTVNGNLVADRNTWGGSYSRCWTGPTSIHVACDSGDYVKEVYLDEGKIRCIVCASL